MRPLVGLSEKKSHSNDVVPSDNFRPVLTFRALPHNCEAASYSPRRLQEFNSMQKSNQNKVSKNGQNANSRLCVPPLVAIESALSPELWGSLRQKALQAKMEQTIGILRSRGAAKTRQINRIKVHVVGSISLRIGNRWAHHLSTLEVGNLPLSHSLRQGEAWAELHQEGRAAR